MLMTQQQHLQGACVGPHLPCQQTTMGEFLYPLNVFQDVKQLLDYCYFCSRDGEYWPEDLRSDPNFNGKEYWPEDLRSDPNFNGKEYWTEDLRTDPNFNGKEYLRRRRHRMAPSRPWAKARARSSRDVQTVLAEHSIHTAQDLANLSGHAWKACWVCSGSLRTLWT